MKWTLVLKPIMTDIDFEIPCCRQLCMSKIILPVNLDLYMFSCLLDTINPLDSDCHAFNSNDIVWNRNINLVLIIEFIVDSIGEPHLVLLVQQIPRLMQICVS